jgi:hypothetical protein
VTQIATDLESVASDNKLPNGENGARRRATDLYGLDALLTAGGR